MVRVAIALACVAELALAAANGNPEVGKRIYREGILSSGRPLRGTTENDVVLEGAAASCVSCHRRSGYGSTEGGSLVPAITARSLFRPTELRQADLFSRMFEEDQPLRFRARTWHPAVRPAYTNETLAVAVRSGRDPEAHGLDRAMPRYHLNNDDMGHLAAYLRTLSTADSPGVDATRIHFATVIAPGFDGEQKAAMLDVMAAYFRLKNADTARLLQRRERVSSLMQDSLRASREWVLHIWELTGPETAWRDQLESYYHEQPVFAVLAGGGADSWTSVHEFCENLGLPCILPVTNLPVISGSNYYSIYFHKGLAGEAESLGHYLRDRTGLKQRESVIQIYRANEVGRMLAGTLRRGFGDGNARAVLDRSINKDGVLSHDDWRTLMGDTLGATLVLWLNDADLSSFDSQASSRIYLSSTLSKTPSLLKAPPERVYLTYPFSLPEAKPAHAQRVRAWLSARKVPPKHERTELNTYFTLSLVDSALAHMVEKYSRDYLIETVERDAETASNPGVFPRLSLGPGQRFASKGSYIVPLTALLSGSELGASDWIVP